MGFWLVAAAIFSVATGAVSYITARKAQKAAKKPNDEQRGVLVNKESNIEQIPVIYGERRVGGVRVFVSTDGTYKEVSGQTDYYSDYDADTESYATTTDTPTNKYLYIALVLCEGEVESITDIYVDDLPITNSKYSGLISYNTYLGTDDQTMPNNQLLREANEFWTADHRLRGVAFLGLRFTWDEEAFSGIPEITALVKGRKVYDPRTATTAWSDNPALCIRDYLTNTRYGKGLPSSAIDDTLIGDAADDCDQSVTLYSGGTTGKTFTCNAVLDTSKTLFDNLNTLLLGCRGFLPYTQGEYRLKIDGSRSSVITFTTDTIIGGIQIKGEVKDEKFNRVTVKFPNPDANWQPDTAIWPPAGSTEETTYLSEDGGVLLHEEIELDTITNYYQARDLARVILLRSRNALTCAIKTTSEALQLEIADVVSITHATPGWTAKPFQVMGMQLNDDGTVDLALLEYDSTIYTWEVDAEQQTYPDTNLPNPFTVAAVSNITVTETTTLADDGTVIPLGVLEWDASYDNLVNQYEIQYKLTSEADTEYKSIFTSVNKYEFYNAEVGTSFTLRIRAINSLNVKGAFTTATFTINGDQTAPSAPTGLSATVGIKNIRLDWTNPSDKDLKVVDVYRHTSNSSGSASKIASIDGESFVDQNITEDTTYYYWLKAVDYSGNSSGFSGVASGSATLVTSGEIEDGSVSITKFASSIEPVTLVTSVPATKSTETIYNTTDNLLYRWDGSEYVSATGATSFSELSGQLAAGQAAVNSIQSSAIQASAITATKVSDGAIETAKLDAGAVTTAKLDALAVTASKIAANTITASKIASNTITANEIATGTITANEISSNTITAGQIAAGAINTSELAADAVTVSKLAASSDTISSGLLFGLGGGVTINGTTACVIGETTSSSKPAGIFASRSNDLAIAAANTGTAGGDYALCGFGAMTYSGGVYSSADTVGCLGSGTSGGYFTYVGQSNDAILSNSSYSVYAQGDIYAAGSYLPFTGSHECVMSESEAVSLGDILVDVSVIDKQGITSVVTKVEPSSSSSQSTAIGVYSGDAPTDHISPTMADEAQVTGNNQITTTEYTLKSTHETLMSTHKVIYVHAVGEGQINVCGEGGDISAGDLIVTSSTNGKGMKQSDDIIRSYTVAKAREGATFSAGETKQIACIYLCG
jgi:hypothetical protein